jgi:hypothetical protein
MVCLKVTSLHTSGAFLHRNDSKHIQGTFALAEKVELIGPTSFQKIGTDGGEACPNFASNPGATKTLSLVP